MAAPTPWKRVAIESLNPRVRSSPTNKGCKCNEWEKEIAPISKLYRRGRGTNPMQWEKQRHTMGGETKESLLLCVVHLCFLRCWR